MTSFDRLSWWCSWLAPAGFGVAVAALLLEALAALRGVDPSGWRAALPALTLAAGCLGVLAHMVVLSHSARAGSFPSARQRERGKAETGVRFGLGYAAWRELMRAQHPELRARPRGTPRTSDTEA
jgi:hypothetical protein